MITEPLSQRLCFCSEAVILCNIRKQNYENNLRKYLLYREKLCPLPLYKQEKKVYTIIVYSVLGANMEKARVNRSAG